MQGIKLIILISLVKSQCNCEKCRFSLKLCYVSQVHSFNDTRTMMVFSQLVVYATTHVSVSCGSRDVLLEKLWQRRSRRELGTGSEPLFG